MVDAHGLPVRLLLTPGQASGKTTFPALIDGLALAHDVVANRGFFARTIIEPIEAGGTIAHIPSQSNVRVRRVVNPEICRQCNLVERCFNKAKHYRRIATRFDKLASNHFAAVTLVSLRFWMRQYQ